MSCQVHLPPLPPQGPSASSHCGADGAQRSKPNRPFLARGGMHDASCAGSCRQLSQSVPLRNSRLPSLEAAPGLTGDTELLRAGRAFPTSLTLHRELSIKDLKMSAVKMGCASIFSFERAYLDGINPFQSSLFSAPRQSDAWPLSVI